MSTPLNTYLVNQNDDLKRIAHALEIDIQAKQAKAQIQSEIEDFNGSESEVESQVREISEEIVNKMKQNESNSDTMPMETDSLRAGRTALKLSNSPTIILNSEDD